MPAEPRARGGDLLLARHGQTNDNLEPIRVQGFSDTPLNEVGVRQAHELAARVADWGLQSLWCSDLVRAAQTAQIIGERIGLTPRPDPRLREGNRGDWEGRLFIEIEADDPAGYAAWRRAGEDFRFPGGESMREHLDRMLAALAEIRAAGLLPALVVCHRGSIRVMLCSRDPRGLDAFHDYDVPNTSVVPF